MIQINNIQVKLHNIQAIKEFEAILKPPQVIVTGSNNKGKTTLLNSISRLFGAKIKLNVTKGEDEGKEQMYLTLENGQVYVMEITTSAGGAEKIKLITPDNKKKSGAEAVRSIQDIFGYLDFHLEKLIALTESTAGRRTLNELILNALPEEQREKYWENFAIYTNSTKAEYKENAYHTRTEINKEIDILVKQSKALTADEQKMLSTGDWSEKLKALKQKKEEALVFNNKVDTANEKLEELNRLKIELEEKLRKCNEDIEAQKEFAGKGKINIETLTDQIDKGDKYVKDYDDAVRRQEEIAEAGKIIVDKRKEAEEQSTIIEAARDENVQIIKEGDFGIKGLEITDDGFSVDDIPFKAEHMAKSDMRKYGALLLKRTNHAPVLIMDDMEGVDSEKEAELVKQGKKDGYMVITSKWVQDQDLQVINKIDIE